MPKLAVVVGDRGQDGRILKKDLESQGFEIIGISRQSITLPHSLGALFKSGMSIYEAKDVSFLLKAAQPAEVYYLAAHHKSSEEEGDDTSIEEYDLYHKTHVVGLLNFLCSIKKESRHTRLFYASSSLVFSGEEGDLQNENTKLNPQGFYGLTKAQGLQLCNEFRRNQGVFASTGILFNHESAYRSERFLSKKIISAAYRIHLGVQSNLTLGNLSARVDWGYAPDYVKAFQSILRSDNPDEFIVSSGEAHSVLEFLEIVFSYFDLDFRRHILEDDKMLERSILCKIGDNRKVIKLTGWVPKYSFRDMVHKLIDDCLRQGVMRV